DSRKINNFFSLFSIYNRALVDNLLAENWLLTTDNCINVAVIGVGVFGRNHARVYRQLEQEGESIRLTAIADLDVARAEAVASEYGVPAFGSLEQLIAGSKIQAASVAVPTIHHLVVARM